MIETSDEKHESKFKNDKINGKPMNHTEETENESTQVVDNETSTKGDMNNQEEMKEQPEIKLTLEQKKSLQEEIKKLSEENKTLKDKLLRTHADYQNYRRRIQEDLNKRSDQGKYWLLSDLLISLDQMFIINKNWNPNDSKNLKTVKLFFQSFLGELEKIGFKKIESIGQEVDLRYHEIVKSPENPNNEKLVIVSEVQSGYLFKDRVIRPAMVELGVIVSNDEDSEH